MTKIEKVVKAVSDLRSFYRKVRGLSARQAAVRPDSTKQQRPADLRREREAL